MTKPYIFRNYVHKLMRLFLVFAVIKALQKNYNRLSVRLVIYLVLTLFQIVRKYIVN